MGIKTWRDLNKHKAKFATIETGGKGRLIGCPVAGWNCHDQKRLDLLGIDFQADELGTEAAAIAEAKAAYMRKEPFLLYLWSPHWFFGEFDMVGVQLPEVELLPCQTHQRTSVVTTSITRTALFSCKQLLLLQLQPLQYLAHLLGNQFLKDQVFFGHDSSNQLQDIQLIFLYRLFQ